MSSGTSDSNRFIILADESADWKIAGLRQLDRLVLALNGFAKSVSGTGKIDAVVFWKPEISATRRWLPTDLRLTRIRFDTSIEPGGRVLATRLLVKPNGQSNFLQKAPIAQLAQPLDDPAELWLRLLAPVEEAYKSIPPVNHQANWHLLKTVSEIKMIERDFLRGAGKSQDGMVAKFFDRRISSSLSRLLLKFPIAPSTWTLAIFPLSLIAVCFLVRGDYIGFVGGAVIFKVYDILDGCDGEIARAKYLASANGAHLDTWCDIVANLLMVGAIGFGLGRERGSFYPIEGVLTGLMIALNEWSLHSGRVDVPPISGVLEGSLYPRHRQIVHGSGLDVLGEKVVWCLVQLTKRDVAVLFFVFLAVINQPQWILHLSLAVAATSLLLSTVARVRRVNRRLTSIRPP